jgi:Leucine-rich repeat (LRR) protein
MTYLVLKRNQLTGIIPDEICDQGDSSPDLDYNQLCPPYPSCIEDYVGEQDLSNCEGLVELWGEYYSIENTTELNLFNNQLSGFIPPEIGNLTSLIQLNLNKNYLTGSIPPEIGNLTNLTNLTLYNNQLSGFIPPEIGNLTNLTNLNLFNNQLTGSIPPEIGSLTNLTNFQLSDNQLTGKIPESICDLDVNWSSYYSLIYNQLCPPYPSCIEDYVGEQDTSNCGD